MRTNVSGVLVINKPTGITSRRAVDRVAKLLSGAKIGHAGTLDPAASGVLVLCIGRVTRLIPYVQRMQKHYRATVWFGKRSCTHDLESDLEEVECPGEIDQSLLDRCLEEFRGTIDQVPPRHSAVRVQGHRAYELARQGLEVPLKPRTVRIDHLECTRLEYPEADIDVLCGSGTYIRSLARDIGERLGCGAVLASLTRVAVGPFVIEDAASVEQLAAVRLAEELLPASAALNGLPQITLDADAHRAVIHGRAIPWPAKLNTNFAQAEVVLADSSGRIIAVAHRDPASNVLQPRIVLDPAGSL